MRTTAVIVIALLFGVVACASGRSRVSISAETVESTKVSDGLREVHVETNAEDTLVRIGAALFVLKGHRGYVGQMTEVEGWVQSGDIVLRYKNAEVVVQGRKAWSTFAAVEGTNVVIDQSGTAGRNVFKN